MIALHLARHSLKTRITLSTLTIFVIGIWMLTFYTSRMLREDIERLLGEQQFSTASFIASQVDDEMRLRLLALEEYTTKRMDPSMLGDSAAMQTRLATSPTIQSMFNAGVFVTGLDGTAIASVPISYGRVGINYSDRDYIITPTKEGKSAIGKPRIGVAVKAPIFAMSAPIRDAKGKVIGVLVGVTDLTKSNFLDKVTKGGYGKTGGYMLIAPKDRLIVTASLKHRIMETLSPPGIVPTMDRIIQGYEGSAVYVNRFGIESLTSTKRIPSADWFAAVDLPTAEAFAPIRDMQQRMLLIALFLTLLAGGLIWWMLRRQLSPLVATANAMVALSQADRIPPPLPVTSEDEVGQLAGGFNRLVEIWTQREDALREQQGIYQAVADNGQALIWMAGIDKGCYYFNQPWLAFTRRTLEQEFGNGWAEGVHPDDLQRCLDIYVTAFDRREAFSMTYRLRRHDGEYRWLLDDGAPRYDSDGLFVGYVGHCLDVTEQQKAEDELRENEALFRAVSESAHDAIVTADYSGKVIKWNLSAGDLFGYAETEAIGQSLTFLMPDRFRDRHVAGMSRVSAGGAPHVMGNPVELVGLRKDGSEFPLELSLARWQISRGNFFTGVIRDITARKKVEQELDSQREHLEELVGTRTASLSIAKEAAEAANRAKSAFLANMSHEIRTPMNGIIGMANILRREGVSPTQAKRLDTIDASARHLLSVINDVLDLSKIEAGKFELEEAPVVISSLLANVDSILAERAKAKGLHLLIESGNLPPSLVGDPTRLQQALLNYATNAVKFTETGTVTLRVLMLEETPDSVTVRFEVQDTGIGITPEAMSRLFSAFEQADNSMTRKYGGTGLGLVITQRLAELMGGKVGADSTAGVGSTFWFTVKLKKGDTAVVAPMAMAVDAEAELRQRYAGQRILVVDDEPINREVTLIQLEAVDLLADMAEDGAEAVSLAQKNSYAAIFMDMQMPKLNGVEATQQIRQLPGYQDTPIIAMTANAFAEDKALCLAAGMNDFLIKPFNPDELFATLLRLLSRRDIS